MAEPDPADADDTADDDTAVALTPVLQDVRAATASLLAELATAGWRDEDVRAATDLPDWTRGHVLSHLARNADAIAGSLAGGLRGETVPMYPSVGARNADIDAGAGRPVTEQLTDLRAASDRLDRVLAAAGEADAWDTGCADDRTAAVLLMMRWCELEIHRVDLGLGTPADWPPDFVARVFPVAADPAVLARRVDRPVRLDVEGGLVADLAGTQWGAGPDGDDREPAVVTAPDWALLGWLTGRHHLDTEVRTSDWALT